MELSPKQQTIKLIEESQKILILTHKDPDGDAIGSVLAMKKVIEKLGKQALICASGIIDQTFSYLPELDKIENTIPLKKESRLLVKNTQNPIESVSWKRISDNEIEILISGSKIKSDDLEVLNQGYDYDTILILDTASPSLLANLWEDNADLFYQVPTISIDHHPSNTQYAKVNLVDVTASATAEILVSIFEALNRSNDIFDEEISTALLTGIMSDTASFMNTNTTPKSLTIAAQLVAAGARQPEIVRNLFKTNSLAKLRVWGRALSYIKEDRDYHFIWSSLSKADFVASGADETSNVSEGVIDALLKTAEDVDFVLLLKEKSALSWNKRRLFLVK